MSHPTFEQTRRRDRRFESSSPSARLASRPAPPVSEDLDPELEPDSLLAGGADLCLAGVVLIVPFIMGGRTPLGEMILVGLACAAALCWGLSQLFKRRPLVRWSGAEILFLLAIGLGIFQLIPLDRGTLLGISPHLEMLLPLRVAGSGGEMEEGEAPTLTTTLPLWNQISLYPALTRQGLILLGAYTLLFFVALQRIRSGEQIERLLKLVSAASVLMAVLGLAQFFFGNGKFFWVFEHPQATTSDFVKGAFSNRNHFAQFLALGVGPLVWLVLQVFDSPGQRSTGKHRSGSRHSGRHHLKMKFDAPAVASVVGLGMVLFAGLLSLSRGGALALFASTGVALMLSARAGMLSPRVLLGFAAAALFLGGGLFFYGQDKVGEKIEELLSGDLKRLDHQDGRIDLWKTVWAAGNHFQVAGGGIGSHRELYPAFQHVPAQHDFTHAENGYLQIFEETGFIGLSLMLCGMVCCLFWLIRGTDPRKSMQAGCAAAIAGALFANGLHAGGDFVWYAPGIMAVVVLLAAAACRISQISRAIRPGSGLLSRGICLTVLLLAVGGGGWSMPQLLSRVQAEPHWNAYQRLAVVRPGETDAPSETKIRNPVPQINALRKLIKANPEDARAHARLARLYLLQFHRVQEKSDNQMDVASVRDAVVNSNFESLDKMNDWLNNAIGRPRKLLDLALEHCRQSLSLCPLPGDVYLYYAKLRFLENPQQQDLSPCWDQAVLLRPMDGNVLFTVGQEYALTLNDDKAYEYWQRAFQAGPIQQRNLIDILASHLKAEEFLKKFQPDVQAAYWLARKFQDLDLRSEYRIALRYYGEASEKYAATVSEHQAAHAWLGAFNVYRELENEPEASRCLQQALEANQNDYNVRLAAGQWALLHQNFPVAEEHLTWCAERRPDNAALQQMVRQISHKTLDEKFVEPLSTFPETHSEVIFPSASGDSEDAPEGVPN